MKFTQEISDEKKEYLEKEYKEYVKKTPMNKEERNALRTWVRNGNSVYENPEGAFQENMAPMEFLDTYRDYEYIWEHTKGMSAEDARKFALAYYGWPDDEPGSVVCDLPLDD